MHFFLKISYLRERFKSCIFATEINFMAEEKLTRINKYLSEVGYCSRREADKLLPLINI